MSNDLLLLLSMAARNLGRNRARTLIAGSGIAIGVGMCIASFGIMAGMSQDMIQSITDVQLGHVQVHEPGFASRPKLDRAFADADERVHAAAGAPGVEAASARVLAWALATTPLDTVGVQLMGVDPERENRLTHLDRRISAGVFLSEAPTPWPAPQPLSAEEEALDRRLTADGARAAAVEIAGLGTGTDVPWAHDEGNQAATRQLFEKLAPGPSQPPPLLLGDELAKRLHAEPESQVELMAQDLSGDPLSMGFRVRGILHMGDPTLDRSRVVMHITDLRNWLALGNRAHELAIRVLDQDRAAPVAAALAAAPEFQELSVETWQQLRPDVVTMVQMNGAFTAAMVAIIFAVAAIGVADTILMAVFERRREFGVLKALGMSPGAIVLMIAVETFLLAGGSALVGLGLGASIDLVLSRWGIPLSGLAGFSMAGAAIPPVLHATLTPEGLLLPVVMILSMALLASLWPALVAARIEPVLAMRER
jgi:ABC-type lipoprotein release transport system permease subunit